MRGGIWDCRYDFFLQSPLLGATQLEAEFDWGGTHIWVSTCVVQGLRCFFIEPANGFFAVNSVYGRSDDAMRFEFFNKARYFLAGPRSQMLQCIQCPCTFIVQLHTCPTMPLYLSFFKFACHPAFGMQTPDSITAVSHADITKHDK